MCVDFRQLIARSVPDAYPTPRINYILERLSQARVSSTLDQKSGYWQIPMASDSKQYIQHLQFRGGVSSSGASCHSGYTPQQRRSNAP